MKNLILLLTICSLSLLGGCMKNVMELKVNNDATAEITRSEAINSEVREMMITQMEAMGGGDENALEEINSIGDEKKAAEELKKLGAEVTEAKKTSEGAFEGSVVKAKIKDVNEFLKNMSKKAKEKTAEASQDQAPPIDPSKMTPKFFKTDDPAIGKLQIMGPIDTTAIGPMDLSQLDEMGDEEREAMEAQLDMMSQMMDLPSMLMQIKVTLPGEIVKTSGCKKTGEKEVTMSFKGTDISIDGMKDFFGLKNGVTATFKIPEDCKIKFQDAKKPAKKTEEKTEESGDRKGGLKIR